VKALPPPRRSGKRHNSSAVSSGRHDALLVTIRQLAGPQAKLDLWENQRKNAALIAAVAAVIFAVLSGSSHCSASVVSSSNPTTVAVLPLREHGVSTKMLIFCVSAFILTK